MRRLLCERIDADADGAIPDGTAIRRWLDSADDRRWAVVGSTHEVIAGPGGWIAVRSRGRFWGLVGSARPRLVVGRGFEPPADISDDRIVGAPVESGPGMGGGTWLASEAAAVLIDPLVGVLNADGAPVGLPVGAAWRILPPRPSLHRERRERLLPDSGYQPGRIPGSAVR